MRGQPLRAAGRPRVGLLLFAILALSGGTVVPARPPDVKETLRFAADMAQRGNWREAGFRWKRLLDEGLVDAKVYNNLAVASEAAGDVEQAQAYYEQALALAGGDPEIADNYRRFERLRELLLRDAAGEEDALGDDPLAGGGERTKGKAIRTRVSVPIPPRLDLEGYHTLLVASFLADESTLLDIDAEIARFLRGEFRRGSKLEVLDVVPAPAIPEQTLDDLIANDEFWKHLGREHGADLIVSGVLRYGRQEVSGFEDVDVIDPATGHKVRETRFVEQEEFSYALDVLFMDGKTGGLLFRDRLRRAVRYRGLMNDPIHAFYEIGESLSDDILAVVSTRIQVETRSVFKK